MIDSCYCRMMMMNMKKNIQSLFRIYYFGLMMICSMIYNMKISGNDQLKYFIQQSKQLNTSTNQQQTTTTTTTTTKILKKMRLFLWIESTRERERERLWVIHSIIYDLADGKYLLSVVVVVSLCDLTWFWLWESILLVFFKCGMADIANIIVHNQYTQNI